MWETTSRSKWSPFTWHWFVWNSYWSMFLNGWWSEAQIFRWLILNGWWQCSGSLWWLSLRW
ncbi:hypothetical protein HanIR_Chr13g0664471 [Helianthus annuus]|nr:hypothetical protein HanIR_Chr13g0664471 [Helianthus annuus]